MAIKSANVIARVDPKVKKEAEQILSDLGLPVSVVINALYRQIIINKKIPFEIKKGPIIEEELTKEELYKLLEERLEEYKKEGGIPAEEVFESLKRNIDEKRKLLSGIPQKSKK